MLTIQMILADTPPETAIVADEDAVLVRQAQQDLSAFTDLYHRHNKRVYRYLLARLGNVDDAQDLTSQTFVAAMENIRKYRGPSPFGAWLLGIARHKAADYFRRKRPDVMLDAASRVPDIDEVPDELIARQLQLEQVAHKLQVLAPDRAEALSLRLFGGLEVAEIARLLGKNEAAVRMLVFRGLRDLQNQLGPVQEERR